MGHSFEISANERHTLSAGMSVWVPTTDMSGFTEEGRVHCAGSYDVFQALFREIALYIEAAHGKFHFY